MKTQLIKLGKDWSIDLIKMISGKVLLQAGSGGGKSYAIRRLLEQSFGMIPHIVLDTEGEFASLREKYDYILIGKGYDIAADPKTAALLAKRLWEERVSAIIDLYELSPWDRQVFVKNFIDAMINAPKDLWKPVLLVIDEAHEYAPESDKSECGRSMHLLASKGRKRNIAPVFATQRISSLSKNIVANCKNKLIGYTSFEGDVKRAAFELGFQPKDALKLRDLEPGEFYAFGNAISKEVIKVKIGEVQTSHDQHTGHKSSITALKASAKVKSALARLADLPQEAEEELRTVTELKAALSSAKREIIELKKKPDAPTRKEVERLTKEFSHKQLEWDEFAKEHKQNVKFVEEVHKVLKNIVALASSLTVREQNVSIHKFPMRYSTTSKRPTVDEIMITNMPAKTTIKALQENGFPTATMIQDGKGDLGICGKKIYSFLYKNEGKEFSKVQLGAVTGYSPTSGGFNNAIGRLNTMSLIRKNGEKISVGRVDHQYLVEAEEYTPEIWFSKLGKCEAAIFRMLWDAQDTHFTKEEIGERTGYSQTSGGFNNAIGHLNTLGLLRRENGRIVLNQELLEL